jgi:signal transduction histidine kinase
MATSAPVVSARSPRSAAALRQLSARAEAAREQERARIARELHDELGQLLTGLKIDLSWLTAELSASPGQPTVAIANKLQAMAGLIELATTSIRQIASELRPPMLDHLGLADTLRWEAATFEQRTGIRCRVSGSLRQEMPAERAVAVFRIFQEALTNVARHAGAGAVRVSLRETARDVILEIRDNGRGISARAAVNPGAIGLHGMHERATLLGGSLSIEGRRGRGTRIILRITR